MVRQMDSVEPSVTDQVKSQRESLVRLQSGYKMNNNLKERINKAVQAELGKDKNYLSQSVERDAIAARAQGFNSILQFVAAVKSGQVVSGALVYDHLKKLRIINEGASLEENRVNFMKLFDNLTGEESDISDFKKVALRLYESAIPYLETVAAVSSTIFKAELKVTKEFIKKGWVKPIKTPKK